MSDKKKRDEIANAPAFPLIVPEYVFQAVAAELTDDEVDVLAAFYGSGDEIEPRGDVGKLPRGMVKRIAAAIARLADLGLIARTQ